MELWSFIHEQCITEKKTALTIKTLFFIIKAPFPCVAVIFLDDNRSYRCHDDEVHEKFKHKHGNSYNHFFYGVFQQEVQASATAPAR